MLIDLRTSTLFWAVLYNDQTDVLLLGMHGETRVTAAEFGQGMYWPDEPGCAWSFPVTRFSELSPIEGVPAPPADIVDLITLRRAQVAAYAKANGGQIHTHTLPPPKSAARRVIDSVREAFRPT